MNRNATPSRIVPVLWLEENKPADARIQQIRNEIAAVHALARTGQDRLVHLALNEAEALAWQTDHPHLVFPLLAEEKIAELKHWRSRQDLLRHESFELAFAA